MALVGHWKFDEMTGTSTVDSSGAGNTGTLTGGPTWRLGAISGALEFDGVDDYVVAAGFSWPTGGPVSIAYWNLVLTGNGGGTAFTIGSNSGASRLQAHSPYSDNVLYFDYGNTDAGGRQSTSYTAFLDAWTHVALVSEGNSGVFKAIYLNGALASSSASSDGSDVALTGINIGAFVADASFHKGAIDDFRVYDHVLSPTEILVLFQGRYLPPRTRVMHI